MKELPILFSAPMVRALLDGTKTQTRRIWKMPPGMGWYISGALKGKETGDICDLTGPGWCSVDEVHCPYGQTGDHLWVRETFAHIYRDNTRPDDRRSDDVAYRADHPGLYEYAYGTWKPSIHMPRWASRITLEVTNVRVERLQEISYEDAIAEGIIDPATIPEFPASLNPSETVAEYCRRKKWPQRQYRDLWESINGTGSWDLNPWVWVVEFKTV